MLVLALLKTGIKTLNKVIEKNRIQINHISKMNDTNDTILPLNKTENQMQTLIEENFNQTYGEINYVNLK